MSSRFFTNQADQTLLRKFRGVFESNADIERFDALVGYLRASGYFAIRPFLASVPHIRILVGINVDAIMTDYHRRGLLFMPDSTKALEEFQSDLRKDIQGGAYSKETENGILQFVEDVISKKISIRAHPTQRLHAKLYIFRPKGFNEHKPGAVITGSSNLTAAGLGTTEEVRNYEFNVLLHDYTDVCFAAEEFERLWDESTEILPKCIEQVRDSTYLRPEKCRQTGLVTIAHEDSGTALETAEHCLAKRDHKAAAVYARTALEAVLHKNADRLHLPVRFKKDHRKLNTEHFLQPIEQRFDHLTEPAKKLEGKELLDELRFARRTVLNAFAHADEISEDEIAGEIEHGISVVRQFQDFMEQLQREDFDESVTQGTLSIPDLLALASKMANAGNTGVALDTLEKAAHALVQNRCELKRVKLEFRRHYEHSRLFGAAFSKTDLSPKAEAHLRMVGPYLLGSVDRDHFDATRFAAAAQFIAQMHLLATLPLFASLNTIH